jgi:hypothetical protein
MRKIEPTNRQRSIFQEAPSPAAGAIGCRAFARSLESSLPQTEKDARFLCMHPSQLVYTARERAATSFPSTHVAQVEEQRHGCGVIGRRLESMSASTRCHA